MDNCKEKIDLGHYCDLKGLIEDTIFTSPADGTAILRGHPSHSKLNLFSIQLMQRHKF